MSIRTVNDAGIKLIQDFEGCILTPYLDPVGIVTIGIGHALVDHGAFLRGVEGMVAAKTLYPLPITLAQAHLLLQADLADSAHHVQNLVIVPLTDNQFAALTSFAFNVGSGNLASSTLLRHVNTRDFPAAAAEFPKWNHSAGKVLAGLTRRRQAEAALFLA